MNIKIFWKKENTKELFQKVSLSLEELGLSEFIKLEETNDEKLKKELDIKKEPALIIEEENIDFKDTIFEWIVPSDEEIKSMLISIIWWWNSESCGWNCSWCNHC